MFLLIDESGEAVIDPEKANVTPSTTDVWYGHSRHPEPRTIYTGEKESFFTVGIGGYRYTEKRMHPEDKLYAIGLFDTIGGAGFEYNVKVDVGHLLRDWKKTVRSFWPALMKIKMGRSV